MQNQEGGNNERLVRSITAMQSKVQFRSGEEVRFAAFAALCFVLAVADGGCAYFHPRHEDVAATSTTPSSYPEAEGVANTLNILTHVK